MNWQVILVSILFIFATAFIIRTLFFASSRKSKKKNCSNCK